MHEVDAPALRFPVQLGFGVKISTPLVPLARASQPVELLNVAPSRLTATCQFDAGPLLLLVIVSVAA